MSDRNREADESSDDLVERFNLDGRREPDTLTRHISDQIDALFRETELLRQPAYSFATELQRRVHWILKQGGGGERVILSGALVPDEYDMHDLDGWDVAVDRTMQASAPRLVWAFQPDLETILPPFVGLIGFMEHMATYAKIPPVCDWHYEVTSKNGEFTTRPGKARGGASSLLPFPRGQYVVIFIVCAGCRAKLDAKYPAGLRWFPEEES